MYESNDFVVVDGDIFKYKFKMRDIEPFLHLLMFPVPVGCRLFGCRL